MEALTLHALMMSSNPYAILLKPNSLAIIEKVRSFRENSKTQIYFTIDAGANIHLLYFANDALIVERFIQSELMALCEKHQVIFDSFGDEHE
jgi:diphosphomevalonate decarboxylase